MSAGRTIFAGALLAAIVVVEGVVFRAYVLHVERAARMSAFQMVAKARPARLAGADR